MTEPVIDPDHLPRATADGRAIIAVQQGLAPHPHPNFNREPVPFRFLQELLLDDETTRYRCAKPLNGVDGPLCGRDDFTNPKSAVSHMNAHGRDTKPIYDPKILQHLVRLCRTYDAAGKRNYCELAAAELNRRGVPTLTGEPWNPQQVSHLFIEYRDKVRTHVHRSQVERAAGRSINPVSTTQPHPRSERVTTSPSESAVDLAKLDRMSRDLLRQAGELFDAQRRLASDVGDFVQEVGAALTRAAQRPTVDPEVVAKAAKWDQVKGLLGDS